MDKLTKYARLIGENVVAVALAVVVIMIIIPLNQTLLDLFFIFNIGFSFLILLVSMNIKEALEFSIYPSLLLVTTIFRLALNVSSTRSILLNRGNAGKVIETFGNYVIQGNIFVGLVIFLIIVIVNFMVISKGSERVAEVTARFTLDAMPGKQMAIDADLNAGSIDEKGAMARRSKIQREADFFGAMDGGQGLPFCPHGPIIADGERLEFDAPSADDADSDAPIGLRAGDDTA